MTYDDGRIACTDDSLVIRRYYFRMGDKRVPYDPIKLVRRAPLLTGKGRIWGAAASSTGTTSIRAVTAELAAHGVTVES
jgi:hypothetical protein